jgi:cobalt/nickel transport system permease protein
MLHIATFNFGRDGKTNSSDRPNSFWNGLAPQTRLLCVVLSVFAITLTPNGRWWTWLVYGVALLIVLFLSRVSWWVLAKRMVVESTFIGTILLGTLFREGGDVLWAWGWMKITTNGLIVLGSVAFKALLSLLILNILTLSTSLPLLLYGLSSLGIPPLLVAILASMCRYIGVLVDEFQAMRRAAAARNFHGGNWWQGSRNGAWQRQTIGNMIGVMFIRTLERGDRIHQAMLSRGYKGMPPLLETPQIDKRDIGAITVTAVVALFGQAIYIFQ